MKTISANGDHNHHDINVAFDDVISKLHAISQLDVALNRENFEMIKKLVNQRNLYNMQHGLDLSKPIRVNGLTGPSHEHRCVFCGDIVVDPPYVSFIINDETSDTTLNFKTIVHIIGYGIDFDSSKKSIKIFTCDAHINHLQNIAESVKHGLFQLNKLLTYRVGK